MKIFNRLMAVVMALYAVPATAQYTDSTGRSIAPSDSLPRIVNWKQPPLKQPFPVKSFIVPALLITYGVTSLENDELKYFNGEIKEEIWDEQPHRQTNIDNYLQYAPALAVYGLNAAGIHGKHNFKDRTLIYGLSTLIMGATTFSLKKTTAVDRPDGSNRFSFPSGHTANAFAAAEFMRQEYKDVSPWYGVAGYAMAVTTGYLRLYNNKHWLSDVVGGAGIGIASTKLAYWLYPKIQHMFSDKKDVHTVVTPTYQNGALGVGLIHSF